MRNLKSIPRAEGLQHLEQHLPHSRLDFSQAISDGFESWKKEAGPFIGFGILSLIIIFVLSLIPLIGGFAISLIVAPSLSLGGYLFAHRVRHNERREFGDFFKGFDQAGEIIISNLILVALAIPPMVAIGLLVYFTIVSPNFNLDSPDLSIGIIIGGILLFVLSIYVKTLLAFYIHLIGFYNISGWDAIKFSARYGHKNWIQIFLLSFITGLLMMLGLIGFVIGIVVTYSFLYPMSYEGFRQVTNLDEFLTEGRNDDMISDHLSSI